MAVKQMDLIEVGHSLGPREAISLVKEEISILARKFANEIGGSVQDLQINFDDYCNEISFSFVISSLRAFSTCSSVLSSLTFLSSSLRSSISCLRSVF